MLYCHTILLYYIFVQNAIGEWKFLLPADVYTLFIKVDARACRVTSELECSFCYEKLEVDGKQLI